jgi:hypothetical protein
MIFEVFGRLLFLVLFVLAVKEVWEKIQGKKKEGGKK